jgi:glycosyltransferase involved in cell wall biosynthesis
VGGHRILVTKDARVRGLKFAHNCGETAASDAGLRAARGTYVMTMDADLQNDPADIPKFWKALKTRNVDCVCGTRVAPAARAQLPPRRQLAHRQLGS